MNKDMLALNSELSDYLSSLLKDDLNAFLKAPPENRAIRVNTIKNSVEAFCNIIQRRGVVLEKLPFNETGFWVRAGADKLSRSLAYFMGRLSIQSASSQIPPIILAPNANQKVLDMAASPGSKSTQLAALMQNQGLLVLNDANRDRLQPLNANTQRCGVMNHAIYNMYGERIGRVFPEYFDKVLLDTPCSGLGILNSHDEICTWWSLEKLGKLQSIQKQLLISAIKALKPGGEIVYSTCSIAPEENEDILTAITAKYPLEIVPIDEARLGCFQNDFSVSAEMEKTLRVWPQHHGMEGFFIAKLRKTDHYFNKHDKTVWPQKQTYCSLDAEVKTLLEHLSEHWGINYSFWKGFRFYAVADRIYMLSADIAGLVEQDFMNAGMLLADQRKPIWKLSHQAIQFIGPHITQRRVTLDDATLANLFQSGKIKNNGLQPGYWTLDIDDQPTAQIYSDGESIRIRLGQDYRPD